MADFSINATQLSAPQGAGANPTGPIAPVERRATNTMPMELIQGIGDVFAKGLQQNAKEEAAKRENSILREYGAKVSKINDALSRGSLKPQVASTMLRAVDNEYAANYPEYIDSLTKQANFFRGKTEVGEAEDKLKREKDQYDKDVQDASLRGYTFYAGMSKEASDAMIYANKLARRNEHEFEQRTKVNAEGRAQATHAMQVQNYIDKEEANQELVKIAGANFDAFSKVISDLRGNTSLSYEDKMAMISAELSRLNIGFQAAAGTNPELANGWKSIFGSMSDLATKMLNPATKAEDEAKTLEAQYNKLITQGKLLAITKNPETYKAVLTTKLFPPELLTQLGGDSALMDWIGKATIDGRSTIDPNKNRIGVVGGEVRWLEPLIGTPKEKIVTDTTMKAIDRAMMSPDKEEALNEAGSLAKNLLGHVGKYGADVPPEQLKEMAKFVSSTQFGKLVAANKIDPDTLQKAGEVFKISYVPAVQEAIHARLMKADDKGVAFINGLEINFSGDRVKFSRNSPLGSNPVANAGMIVKDVLTRRPGGTLADQFVFDREVKKAEDALNKVVYMGAHLEGYGTDYGKYWEQNKHFFFPQLYQAPTNTPDDKPAKSKSVQSAGAYGSKQVSTGKITPAKQWWEE